MANGLKKKKLWCGYILEYYSVIKKKRNELSSREEPWRNLQCMLLSERTSLQRLHVKIPTLTFWIRQNDRDSEKASGCQEFKAGGEGVNGYIAQQIFKALKLFCMIL